MQAEALIIIKTEKELLTSRLTRQYFKRLFPLVFASDFTVMPLLLLYASGKWFVDIPLGHSKMYGAYSN